MNLFAKCISVMFFMVVSLTLSANVEPTVSIRSQKDQSFSLHLKDINNATYQIKLSDRKGVTLLNDKVENQADYLKFFNLENLPTGDYQLKIESEEQIIIQQISINDNKVVVDMAARKEIGKNSLVEQKKRSKKVNMATSGSISPTTQAINNKIKWMQTEKVEQKKSSKKAKSATSGTIPTTTQAINSKIKWLEQERNN